MSDDELPDFSIPPGMKLPGSGDPIGNWLDTHATKIPLNELAENLKGMSRVAARREWRNRLGGDSPN